MLFYEERSHKHRKATVQNNRQIVVTKLNDPPCICSRSGSLVLIILSLRHAGIKPAEGRKLLHLSLTFAYFLYVGVAEVTPNNYFQRLFFLFFVDVR